MSHLEHAAGPAIPFSDADKAALRHEDVRAAEFIGGLCTGIFAIGFVLYTIVVISTWVQDLIYQAVR